MQPFIRIGNRILASDIGQAETLHADGQPFDVHHAEHRGQATVFVADEITLRIVEIEHAGRRALDAHLVLDRAGHDVIALADRAVVVDTKFWDQEQADATRAFRRTFDSCNHHVNDVFRKVVVARGDEDFGAADVESAVIVGHGFRRQQAEIRAAVRLAKAHRAGPGALHHVWQKLRTNFVTRIADKQVTGAASKLGV